MNSNLFPTLDALRNEPQLKALTAELRRSSELRSQWGQNVTIWRNIAQVLEEATEHPHLSIALLQFLNNITASNGVGKAALPTGFLRTFSLARTGKDVTQRRLYWQILANFAFSFAGQHSLEFEQAVVEASANLPFEDSITSGSEAVAFPCLVFISTANTLIASLTAKIQFNVGSRALGALLDVLPLWFAGGQDIDNCIIQARRTFEEYVSSGAFPDVLKAYQYNTSRELTLLSLFDAVIAAPSFSETKKDGSQYLETESGKEDVAALGVRLVESTHDVIKLISKSNRTIDESAIANQRALKLLDILITLLSHAPVQMRQDQRHFVPELVKLLIELKKIPSISKLGNARSFEELPVDVRNFPGLKTHLLMLLAVLVQNDFESQELIRECGGLAAVLECCVIDGNNPFMKERAIVCLRYVLKDNATNQSFVASLEARQVADPEALAEAGYEASFVDGKLALKSRSSG